MKPETWQFLILLDYVDVIPIAEVDWLLGSYGKGETLTFWTSSYDRMAEALARLDESTRQ